jgi:general secretion pathway protein C
MKFEPMLRRNFGVVHLALIAVAAYFQASGITQVVGSAIAPSGVPLAAPAASRGTAPAHAALDHATSARAILDRNPFDSVSQRPLDAPAARPDAGSSPGMTRCEGFRALIAVASSQPAWSVAVVSQVDGGTELVRVGNEFGGMIVELVEWNRVVMSSGSALCEMVMFRLDKPIVRGGKPPPQTVDAGGVPPEIASKIQRRGPTEFDVDRQAIATIIERQVELMRVVRIVPVQEDGRVLGLQLFGVRPGSILGLLGFEQGDRLQTINGFDLTNPESAMQAYARLRAADHLVVQVNRRGQDTNLDFNVK